MPKISVCSISGEEFEVSDLEIEMRKSFGVSDLPDTKPEYRIRELGAFWQHWNLYKRKCDKTGKDIISVFREDCDYPVWNKDEWVAHANPPEGDIDFDKPVFPQMWEFFQKSPIPHITGTNNQNCEYTDDAWFSKNCYLCHSFLGCEDMSYCYRPVHSKDCFYCAFSISLELCYDTVNSHSCFNLIHGLNCRNCTDSAFLYDCRNCDNCMFCSNLRNKRYCFFNEQLSKEDYERKKGEWNLSSRKTYRRGKEIFEKMLVDVAFHRALNNDNCENTTGNHNVNCNDSVNCFFSQDNDQCVNCFRNYIGKTSLDFHGHTSERCFYTILGQDKCYELRFCSQVVNSRYMEYCAFCLNCENCFGCCGLANKKFYIFNKPYSEEEYYEVKEKIGAHMKTTGEWGRFFPGYFAQNPYDESWSGFYFPLNKEEQEKLRFKYMAPVERRKESDLDADQVPDSSDELDEGVFEKVFWDEKANKPFKVRREDAAFAKRLKVPLPDTYYITRIHENVGRVFFDGKLRKTACAKCNTPIETSFPSKYDGRVLCEKDYLKFVK
jgi:hypothetical protein